MLSIGLTGGIACGKSTVTQLFAVHGIDIIDADQIAEQVVAPGSSLLSQIVDHFGNHVINNDGQLNRQQLRQLIFQQPEQRKWLEQLTHPVIRQTMQQQLRACESIYCLLSVPLLIETLPNPLINRILVIDCSSQQQFQRLLLRDNISHQLAEQMIGAQISSTKRLAKADDVIDNNGNHADLVAQVEKLHKCYEKLANEQRYKR